MAWHYHDDDVPGPAASIQLNISNLPVGSGSARMDTYLVDHDHSNAYTTWQEMGSPQDPSPEQYLELEESSLLEKVTASRKISIREATADIELVLKRQAVTLLLIEFP